MQELPLPAWIRRDDGVRRAVAHRPPLGHRVAEEVETRRRARRESPEWRRWLEQRQTLGERIQSRRCRAEGPRVLETRRPG